jgi:Ion channel/Pentapeptide repeats (8 copies)
MADDPLSGYEEVDDGWFEEKFGRKLRRNQAQYDFLLKCSKKKDMTEWNKWRDEHSETEDVWLEGVDLHNAHLRGADLEFVNLKWAYLKHAHLDGASLDGVHLEAADLSSAHLEEATLLLADLEGISLLHAHLEGANLLAAHLEGADLFCAHLEGSSLYAAIVDNETHFTNCTVDKNTDFRSVGMGSCRMTPGLKDTLEYNIRRMRYRDGSLWANIRNLPANFFWFFSDYGRSTGRIIATFLVLSLAFAVLYYVAEIDWGERMVQNLSTVTRPAGEVETIGWRLVPFRALYFSVVTMTTLGFGDMHADPHSFWGHAALMLQVILGYVLLGALVCRLGILFQGHGPPVKFSPEWKPQELAPLRGRSVEAGPAQANPPKESSADQDGVGSCGDGTMP